MCPDCAGPKSHLSKRCAACNQRKAPPAKRAAGAVGGDREPFHYWVDSPASMPYLADFECEHGRLEHERDCGCL